MSEYQGKKVNLPVAVWEALDRMVAAQGGNTSTSFHIEAALSDYLEPRNEIAIKAVDGGVVGL